MSTPWGKLSGSDKEPQPPATPAQPTPEKPEAADELPNAPAEAAETPAPPPPPSADDASTVVYEQADTPDETIEAPSSPSSEILRAEGLERWLGEAEAATHALRGVSLSLERGQAYSVVGQSGCGKSTLLYLLGLLDRPNAGEIWIAGKPMSSASDADRTAVRNEHIGFVFQFHFLLPEFSALENVMLPMRKLGRLSPGDMRERARELLEAVGLGNKTHRSTGHLSGGEQQRVAVARALSNSPGVILADEPTGNLDAHNSALIFDLMLRVAHEMQQAVLIVSHNTDMAARCDKVLRMRDGLFESDGQ